MKAKFIVLVLVTGLLAGCYYDNEEELYSCKADAATAKYNGVITSILNAYGCIGCHSGAGASGGVNLSTHASVKTVADNGRLYGAITHAAGFSPMPQGGGKMTECDIKKVKAWIDAGAPNN